MADTDDTPTEQLATGSEEDSLEGSSTIVEASAAAPAAGISDTGPGAGVPTPPEKPKTKWWRRLLGSFNIYLLLFVLLLIVAAIIMAAAYFSGQHSSNTGKISSQTLSQNALNQLANSDVNVGSPSQILNVKSSAVFAGKVLVRQDLEVAGNLQLSGALALNDLSVSGTAQFNQTQVNKNLSVAGNAGIQGTVTIAKSLQVSGSGSFSGPLSAPQLTTSSLQLNGDLLLTHHITAGGATPSRSNGGALGSGGTSSVSGSDTAGSIAITTGGGPGAGCFVTINFASKYSATPHVLVTPVGSAAGGLSYYINRSTTSFSICVASAPPAGSSFGFDYFVVD